MIYIRYLKVCGCKYVHEERSWKKACSVEVTPLNMPCKVVCEEEYRCEKKWYTTNDSKRSWCVNENSSKEEDVIKEHTGDAHP